MCKDLKGKCVDGTITHPPTYLSTYPPSYQVREREKLVKNACFSKTKRRNKLNEDSRGRVLLDEWRTCEMKRIRFQGRENFRKVSRQS